MRSILEELFVGNVRPGEDLEVKDPEYKKVTERACKLEAELRDKLSSSDREKFDEMTHLMMTSAAMETTAAFVEGFKLGALNLISVNI